jgi:hypothetical protein
VQAISFAGREGGQGAEPGHVPFLRNLTSLVSSLNCHGVVAVPPLGKLPVDHCSVLAFASGKSAESRHGRGNMSITHKDVLLQLIREYQSFHGDQVEYLSAPPTALEFSRIVSRNRPVVIRSTSLRILD